MTTNPTQVPLPGTTTPQRTIPKHDVHKFCSVTKLTDVNWVQHKFEQVAALEERGLYDIVMGKEYQPDQSVEPEAYTLWRDKDVSAKAQIIQNLSSEVQPIIFDCNTSEEVWKALHDEYESSNLDKVANIRYTYDTLAYVEGSGMQDHLNCLKTLHEQLGAMGDKISDTSHALRMLRLLPPSWDGINQVLCILKPMVVLVKDKLLAEEQSRKTALAYANIGSASALMTPSTLALLSAIKDPQQLANLQKSPCPYLHTV